ncbi:hypothetical protein HRbin23_00732 [bacterium HR23]|nr:hypothetical protein HRbin23_00732 [bacterium HR23]
MPYLRKKRVQAKHRAKEQKRWFRRRLARLLLRGTLSLEEVRAQAGEAFPAVLKYAVELSAQEPPATPAIASAITRSLSALAAPGAKPLTLAARLAPAPARPAPAGGPRLPRPPRAGTPRPPRPPRATPSAPPTGGQAPAQPPPTPGGPQPASP